MGKNRVGATEVAAHTPNSRFRDAVATRRPPRSAQPAAPAAPRLSDIRPEDLHSPERLQALRRQALACGWIRDCEADTLNFFAAAVRARSTEARDPVRVFVSLVRGRR